ncbi:sialate O-acetylesterase [Akkermansiaceae bacterium]|nr:sialate O-acetylesterase [Akkermansiaceae bacterium]MDB4741231.1 sialate O-acetylesterase [Akkermansiaceae bacterium]MDB4765779.1 sialate O-acetylesterase [Akkermansiaceae bacterium]
MSDRRRKNDQLARLLQLGLALALVFIAPVCAGEKKTGKHLFILSGQSNMTGAVKAAFTAHVEEQYGKENSVVVMRMKSGRGIRFWVADYDQPADRGLNEKKMTSNGMEYKPLLETALAAVKAQSFDTVGFIWMQGESDANNRLSEVYEESFLKLVGQLRKDLKRVDLYYVIGRINDYAKSRPDNVHWKRVRETQIKLGKTPGNAWIDTDDLNGGNADNPDGDIHFPREGALRLGRRFADKAIEMINSKK